MELETNKVDLHAMAHIQHMSIRRMDKFLNLIILATLKVMNRIKLSTIIPTKAMVKFITALV